MIQEETLDFPVLTLWEEISLENLIKLKRRKRGWREGFEQEAMTYMYHSLLLSRVDDSEDALFRNNEKLFLPIKLAFEVGNKQNKLHFGKQSKPQFFKSNLQ